MVQIRSVVKNVERGPCCINYLTCPWRGLRKLKDCVINYIRSNLSGCSGSAFRRIYCCSLASALLSKLAGERFRFLCRNPERARRICFERGNYSIVRLNCIEYVFLSRKGCQLGFSGIVHEQYMVRSLGRRSDTRPQGPLIPL